MKVHHVWPLAPNKGPQLLVQRPVPDSFERQRQKTHAADFIVTDRKTKDLLSPGFKQSRFVAEDLVLAATLLVVIMDDEYLHRSEQPSSLKSLPPGRFVGSRMSRAEAARLPLIHFACGLPQRVAHVPLNRGAGDRALLIGGYTFHLRVQEDPCACLVRPIAPLVYPERRS